MRYLNVKTILWVIIVSMLVTVAAVFVGYRYSSDPLDEQVFPISKQTSVVIKNFHYTAYRLGDKAWAIEAEAAYRIQDSESETFRLEKIRATYFQKDSSEISLQSHRGVMSATTNNVVLSGNVALENNLYRLATQSLHYEYERNIIYSENPVEISANGMKIKGSSMVFDLNSKQMQLDGEVKGTFSGDMFI